MKQLLLAISILIGTSIYAQQIPNGGFENWVQERGLYFPNKWAKEFTPLLGMNDKNNKLTKGALLVAPYGKRYAPGTPAGNSLKKLIPV